MRKCLITGCGGFIGSYLANFLLEKNMNVYGLVHHQTKAIDHLKDKLTILRVDITDKDRLTDIVTEVKPDLIFHLAARTSVFLSWQDSEETLRVNISGTLYLLDSVRKAGINPVVEVVGSSSEYGLSYENEIPIRESKELRPSSPYAVSKIGQDMLAYLYWRTYGMKIIRIRPFYIIGPGKIHDACSDFATGIVEVQKGLRKALYLGNLEAVRDTVDVRDAVEAMWLVAERGTPGDVYNLCSGVGYKMEHILDTLISLSGIKIPVSPDPKKMRPADDPIYIGDPSKLHQLGWKPRIPLQKTLEDILVFIRSLEKA